MNPIRTLKVITRLSKLLSLFEKASKDWDERQRKGEDMSKSIFKSKTFWVNVLSAGLELTQVLPIPPGTLLLVTNALNIALRVITEEPVHVVSPK